MKGMAVVCFVQFLSLEYNKGKKVQSLPSRARQRILLEQQKGYNEAGNAHHWCRIALSPPSRTLLSPCACRQAPKPPVPAALPILPLGVSRAEDWAQPTYHAEAQPCPVAMVTQIKGNRASDSQGLFSALSTKSNQGRGTPSFEMSQILTMCVHEGISHWKYSVVKDSEVFSVNFH